MTQAKHFPVYSGRDLTSFANLSTFSNCFCFSKVISLARFVPWKSPNRNVVYLQILLICRIYQLKVWHEFLLWMWKHLLNKINKTTGHNRNFCAFPCLRRELLKGWKHFSRKHTSFSLISYFLKCWKFSDCFARKSSKLGSRSHFQEIRPFDTHSTANLQTLATLKIFIFSEKLLFTKSLEKLNVLRSPNVSVAFFDKFTTIRWGKCTSFGIVNEHHERNWQTLGTKEHYWWV